MLHKMNSTLSVAHNLTFDLKTCHINRKQRAEELATCGVCVTQRKLASIIFYKSLCVCGCVYKKSRMIPIFRVCTCMYKRFTELEFK